MVIALHCAQDQRIVVRSEGRRIRCKVRCGHQSHQNTLGGSPLNLSSHVINRSTYQHQNGDVGDAKIGRDDVERGSVRPPSRLRFRRNGQVSVQSRREAWRAMVPCPGLVGLSNSHHSSGCDEWRTEMVPIWSALLFMIRLHHARRPPCNAATPLSSSSSSDARLSARSCEHAPRYIL